MYRCTRDPQGKIMAQPGPPRVGRDVCWTAANRELSLLLPWGWGAGARCAQGPRG